MIVAWAAGDLLDSERCDHGTSSHEIRQRAEQLHARLFREARRLRRAQEGALDDAGYDTRRDTISEKARDNAGDIADEAKDVGKGARKLADAEHDFKYAKMVRVQTLRAVHAVVASQPMLINAFSSSLPIVALISFWRSKI